MKRHSIKDDRWHILNRTNMYLGSTVSDYYNEYILEDNKIEYKKLKYTPALVKMINEIIDNSVDALKSKKSGKINVEIDKCKVSVSDNGDGIPVEYIKGLDGKEILIPFACWGLSKAGSNFNDDDIDKTTIGTNGVGSFCANVLSKEFIGVTCDGKKSYKIWWKNNAGDVIEETVSNKKTKGTKVIFEPDSTRLDYDTISLDVKLVIKQRLINLSSVYPKITFTFNKEVIKYTREDLVKMLGTNMELYEEDKFSIAVIENNENEFKCFTLMNGLNMKGGSHIDYILKKVVKAIQDKLPKKYNNIKYGDIKNKIKIAFIGNDFSNIKFETQTKETLKNSDKEISNYLGDEWVKIVDKILKNKNMLINITSYYDALIDAEAKKALKGLVKTKGRIKIEKYKPAINENKYLMVSEGLSAGGAILTALGRDNIGAYPLKGKPLNCMKCTIQKVKSNQEIKDIIEILGVDLSSKDLTDFKPRYDNILCATDADVDGANITMLILTFFMKYYPEFIKQNRFKMLKTPVIIAYKKDKPYKYFFNLEEFQEFEKTKEKGIEYKYKKGLASITEIEYEWLFKNGLDNFIEDMEWSDDLPEVMELWMGKDPTERKKILLGQEFDLFNV